VSISYPPISESKIVSSIVHTDVAAASTSNQMLAANPNRASGTLIVNNTTKILWIALVESPNQAAINALNAFALAATGGNYLLPPNYLGSVQGILVGPATGKVRTIEPIY
jgi:hypothetical protein